MSNTDMSLPSSWHYSHAKSKISTLFPAATYLGRPHLDVVVSALWTRLGWSSCRLLSCSIAESLSRPRSCLSRARPLERWDSSETQSRPRPIAQGVPVVFFLQGRRVGCYTNACHPVGCCGAYHATKISPIDRLARTRHRSDLEARFFHCCWRGCIRNSSGWFGGEARARASAANSWAVLLDSLLPRHA